MAKICAISKSIGLTEKAKLKGPRKLNRDIMGNYYIGNIIAASDRPNWCVS